MSEIFNLNIWLFQIKKKIEIKQNPRWRWDDSSLNKVRIKVIGLVESSFTYTVIPTA